MNEWKEGDVFFWDYTDEELKRRSHGNNGGTTYWCVSQIGIVNDEGWLVDTYYSTSDNKAFNKELADEILELHYQGNLNDYRKAEPYERACYSDSDCLDLNHPNSTRGNFYIRKDATHDLGKKRRVIERSKKLLEDSIKYQLSQIKRYQKILDDKSYEDMQSISYEKDVSLYDTDWGDE